MIVTVVGAIVVFVGQAVVELRTSRQPCHRRPLEPCSTFGLRLYLYSIRPLFSRRPQPSGTHRTFAGRWCSRLRGIIDIAVSKRTR